MEVSRKKMSPSLKIYIVAADDYEAILVAWNVSKRNLRKG
jgi:hypothetical protein